MGELGLIRPFAKGVSAEKWDEGSNPSISATVSKKEIVKTG